MLTLGIGIIIAWVPILLTGLWFMYRIVKAWMAQSSRRPMYL